MVTRTPSSLALRLFAAAPELESRCAALRMPAPGHDRRVDSPPKIHRHRDRDWNVSHHNAPPPRPWGWFMGRRSCAGVRKVFMFGRVGVQLAPCARSLGSLPLGSAEVTKRAREPLVCVYGGKEAAAPGSAKRNHARTRQPAAAAAAGLHSNEASAARWLAVGLRLRLPQCPFSQGHGRRRFRF